MPARSRKLWWSIGIVAAVVVLAVVVGPFVYIHFIESDPPPRFQLGSGTATATTTPGSRVPLAGTWKVDTGSGAGYRVKEILFGQDNTAAGRTSQVTGTVAIDGATVRTANVTVDLASVKSDRSRRDDQFRGRIMDVAQFPNATFTLTKPIDLGTEPADGAKVTVNATGNLTLHGTTKPVTMQLDARRTGNTIEVTGSTKIVFADYGIPNPSIPGISADDNGELEFDLVLHRS